MQLAIMPDLVMILRSRCSLLNLLRPATILEYWDVKDLPVFTVALMFSSVLLVCVTPYDYMQQEGSKVFFKTKKLAMENVNISIKTKIELLLKPEIETQS